MDSVYTEIGGVRYFGNGEILRIGRRKLYEFRNGTLRLSMSERDFEKAINSTDWNSKNNSNLSLP